MNVTIGGVFVERSTGVVVQSGTIRQVTPSGECSSDFTAQKQGGNGWDRTVARLRHRIRTPQAPRTHQAPTRGGAGSSATRLPPTIPAMTQPPARCARGGRTAAAVDRAAQVAVDRAAQVAVDRAAGRAALAATGRAALAAALPATARADPAAGPATPGDGRVEPVRRAVDRERVGVALLREPCARGHRGRGPRHPWSWQRGQPVQPGRGQRTGPSQVMAIILTAGLVLGLAGFAFSLRSS